MPYRGGGGWGAVPSDLALPVGAEPRNRKCFWEKGQVVISQADAVEGQLQPAFAYEVARIFVGLEMSHEIGAAGKHQLTEHLDSPRMAEKRIACAHGGR